MDSTFTFFSSRNSPVPTPALQSALADLEKSFAEIGVELKTVDPEQHARLAETIEVLRSGKGDLDQVKPLIGELLKWQLGLQKASFEEQLVQLAPAIAQQIPAALEAQKALKAASQLISDALDVSLTRRPSSATIARLQASADEVETAATRAGRAIERSTIGVTMTPVLKQPVSASGVRLKPVEPAREKSDQPLEAFKLRPGALPPASKPTPSKSKK